MNKRQRKKYAKKHASPSVIALIESTRKILRRDTLMSEKIVNDAWRKFNACLRNTVLGPISLPGYFAVADQFEVVTEADLERWSKASGTHAAAGKEE